MSIKHAGPRCCHGGLPQVYKQAHASESFREHRTIGLYQPRSQAQMYFSGLSGDPKNNSIYAFSRDKFPNLLQFYHVPVGTQLSFELCAGKCGLSRSLTLPGIGTLLSLLGRVIFLLISSCSLFCPRDSHKACAR